VITRIILIIAAAVCGLGTVACGGSARSDEAGGGGDPIQIVAGFYPLAFAAEQIGGETVEVRNLTPPGAEPHDFELAPRDVEAVRSADLVLYLGRGFQPALEDALTGAEGETLDLLDGLSLRGRDPHVWLDPLLYAQIGRRIGEELGRPEAATELSARLEALDAELERGLADCERRVIVTSHEAFAYLAARYGLEQIAVTGLAPEAEPAPQELERIVELVRESGATTIFFETLVSPRLAETVAREAGAKTAVLNPLEGLTEEELEAGADYFAVMRENLAALREGLGC
jgi:zinc transport system substrate-binding protein